MPARHDTTIIRSNYLLPGNLPFYEHSMKLWEELQQDLNYNAMVSQRGVINLFHSDAERDHRAGRAVHDENARGEDLVQGREDVRSHGHSFRAEAVITSKPGARFSREVTAHVETRRPARSRRRFKAAGAKPARTWPFSAACAAWACGASVTTATSPPRRRTRATSRAACAGCATHVRQLKRSA